MNHQQIYDYLMRARRDLWAALKTLPDDVLSKPLLDGERFHSIKDLVAHIPSVEDGWINEDIRRIPPVWNNFPDLHSSPDITLSISVLINYWRAVETTTLSYFENLNEKTLNHVITPHDEPDTKLQLDGVLSHVMFHEMRHTAQICTLLRIQGIKPPALDLLWYLPV